MKTQKSKHKFLSVACLSFGILLMLPLISFGQNKIEQIKKFKAAHYEVPNDKYVPVDQSKMQRTPAYTIRNRGFFTTQVNLDADGNNIVGDAGNEPSIAIDPTDPNRIVIGWREFGNISSDFRQAGYAYSVDGGQTWTNPGPIDPTIFRSDPVLDFDADGNFYYNSLTVDESTMEFSCNTYRILDGGVEWDNGVYSYGGDKLWMRVDRTNGVGAGNNYSFWSFYGSACNGSFTRSTDGGDSYEDCISVSGDPIFGTLAVGQDGTLYIFGVGLDSFVLAKSSTAQNPDTPVSWDSYQGIDLDGDLGFSPTINPEGLMGQAWVDVDISNGPGQGNVYVLASVVRHSNDDPADVMFAKSTDGGQTFTSAIRINTDEGTGNYQWFGTLSVAPNGRIDVVWLDTRDAPAGSQHFSALYYSYSTDQGETFSENEKLSDLFDPHIGWPQQQKMGDYFDMVSDNDGVHLAWANTLNNGEDVYYAYITPTITGIDKTDKSEKLLLKNFPNPFSNETTISFSLNEETHASIDVFNTSGQKVKTLINQEMHTGFHQISWDGCSDAGVQIPEGFYYYRLKAGNYIVTRKMLKIH